MGFIRIGQGSTAHSKVSLNFATEMDHHTMLIVGAGRLFLVRLELALYKSCTYNVVLIPLPVSLN